MPRGCTPFFFPGFTNVVDVFVFVIASCDMDVNKLSHIT